MNDQDSWKDYFSPGSSRSAGALLAAFLFFVALAAWLQWAGGAYHSEFGEHADEPAHYMTGLMVRDYVAGGLPKSPVAYAKEYYQHYPKIGLGHWPPAFYVVQAVWTLPFSVSRTSVMLLQAVLAALLATGLFAMARHVMPVALALATGAVLLFDPLMQGLTREVMAEVLTATTIFFALWCYCRYLDSEHRRYATGFGVLAGMALLTKGTAALLIPVPLLCVLLTRRFRLLGQPWFWIPALIAGALAGPWYLLAPGSMHEHALPGHVVAVNEVYVTRSVTRYFSLTGQGLAPFLLLGLGVHVAARLVRRKPIEGAWAVAAAALLAMVIVRTVIPPARPVRHLLNVMPFWLLFAAAGLWWVMSLRPFQRLASHWRAAIAVMLLPGLFALDYRPLRKKDYGGFEAVAKEILARPEWKDSVILVSSDASGEGMLISEIAMRQRRPGHLVLRGTKVLSSSTWFGWNARTLFSSPKEIDEFLRGMPAGLVVFDGEPTRTPVHHEALKLAIRASPERWELVDKFPQRRGQGDRRDGIYLYRLKGHEGRKPANVPNQLRTADDS
jgi:hypothetical protein